MITEFGHFCLALALCVAMVQLIAPLWGAHRGDAALMAVGLPAARATALLTMISLGCLIWAFATSDFSVANVYQNSHSLKPMLFKLSAAWGNHEGSLLLWIVALTTFGAAVATFGGALPDGLRARVVGVQGGLILCFIAFTLFTSNPFERLLPAPADGVDLNPLLQDPALAFHPPMLYLGYVGLSVCFSFAIAALLEGRVDPAWARWVRPWALAAWSLLTAGIALGSWWAYYELGWGGFWYWDPVENASFMPWLAATALLHSAAVTERRGVLKSWTVLLAIVAFGLSLIGAFLVRSGVLTSVHAFALDPERGVFILAIIAATLGGGLALYAWRAPSLRTTTTFAPISREGGLLLNNVLLMTALAVVMVGTLYPLALEAVGGARISVGPPFFNATFGPLMIPLLLLAAAGPLLPWRKADFGPVARRLWIAGLGGVGVAAAAQAFFPDGPTAASVGGDPIVGLSRALETGTAAATMGLAFWLLLGAITEQMDRAKLFRVSPAESWRRLRLTPRATYGMTLSHIGVALLTLGVAGTTLWTAETIYAMRPGDTVAPRDWGGETLMTFFGAEDAPGPNYSAERGHLRFERAGEEPYDLYPELRFYPVAQTQTAEVGIHHRWTRDVYVSMSRPDGVEDWTITVRVFPLVNFIWLGAALMMLGGLVSLADRRLRLAAPRRSAATPTARPAPAPA